MLEAFPPLSQLHFEWPWAFAALALPLIALLLPKAQPQQQASIALPTYRLLADRLDSAKGKRGGKVLRLAALCAYALLVAAAARPQYFGEPIELPVTGRDLLLAVDISGSMETDDMEIGGRRVNRLQAVKAVASDFIERREGDRVGLILFGQQAFLQAPLTFDLKTVERFLMEAEIGLAGRETAIGDAIGIAVKRLREKEKSNRVVVLLTDGRNTAGALSPQEATELAVSEGITIYTIGMGADEMVVRGLFGARRVNPSADLDEASLQQIAQDTGGRYFRARDPQELVQIYQLLDELEPVSEDHAVYRPVNELYRIPLLAATLISLLVLLVRPLGMLGLTQPGKLRSSRA